MALKINQVVDIAERMLRTDAFSSAAKNGKATSGADRKFLSQGEQEELTRHPLTYAGAQEVRRDRGEAGQPKTAPAALVYQTALTKLKDALGEVDGEHEVTLEWLDEMFGNDGDAASLLNLAAASSDADPISFAETLEFLTLFFDSNDIDMGGGVWLNEGQVPQDARVDEHALQLLKDFIREREEFYEEHFDASHFQTSGVADVDNGIRAAGRSIAADGFAEAGTANELRHGALIASLVRRMGEGIKHTSATARVVGESLKGERPVFASIHLFFRPDGSHVAISSIGGEFSRSWKASKVVGHAPAQPSDG